jgi:hypothetical protein
VRDHARDHDGVSDCKRDDASDSKSDDASDYKVIGVSDDTSDEDVGDDAS